MDQSGPACRNPRAPGLPDPSHFACWNLTTRGNLAFIANQMGHKGYSMLATVYGRWIDTESSREIERIREGMQNMARITPKLHQEAAEKSLNC